MLQSLTGTSQALTGSHEESRSSRVVYHDWENCSIEIIIAGAGEMAQWVTHVLGKHGTGGWIPSTHMNSQQS